MNDNDYSRRQAIKDAAYRAEYEAWQKSLPPKERAVFKARGLDEPEVSHHGTGMSDRDLADSPLASEEPDIIGQIEPEASESQPQLVNYEAVWDAMRRMLGELLNQKNAKLTLECFAVVSGTSFTGDSMTTIARRHGVTRAAVSKRCIDIARQLRLPPSRSMRAELARESYRKAQISNHSRKNL